jgi:hypothetical protein
MKIIKCDKCAANLEGEKYYEVGNIEFHFPDCSSMRVNTSSSEIETYDNTQSWVSYNDIHFCELCWDKENFKNYLPKLS